MLQNFEEVVTSLCMRLFDRPKSSYSGSIKPLHRTLWHVKVEDVDRVSPLFICDPIKSTMKIHLICASNKTITFNYLSRILHASMSFVWIVVGQSAKM
jgi:hypothetical protein